MPILESVKIYRPMARAMGGGTLHKHIPNYCTLRRLCYEWRVTPSRSLIEDDWPVIRRLLPDDLEQSAREHGAMRRRRGQVNSAEQLLRLILMHVAGRLSLEQTVTRAQARGLATLNALALHKRLCTSRQCCLSSWAPSAHDRDFPRTCRNAA